MCENQFLLKEAQDGTLTFLANNVDPYKMNWIEGEHSGGSVTAPEGIAVQVTRNITEEGNLREEYNFTNVSEFPVFFQNTDLGIYATFNDSYEDATTCMKQRCHTHLYCNGEAAYVMALRMGGEAPHLGMMLLEGGLNGYSIQRKEKELTSDEKIMRWALNKFFYTKHQNTLTTAYTMMLKEKYVDGEGNLLPHPSIYQFRYFYKKTKNMQNYYIAREGIKKYQRDYRPLLGEGIQEFACNVGVGMLDSTICDIYLINDKGEVIGHPVLTACIDAYSSLCCGYSVGWEGGTYSLRGLMLNVVTDKVEHCLRHGIAIDTADWDCKALPGTLVTDKGTEYASENFEQLTDFGITIINLPAYRPELKGAVEKFFDLIQNSFKPYLRGKPCILRTGIL